MGSLVRSFLQIFFPEHCHGCGKPGSALCTTCINTIPLAPDLPAKTFAVFDYGNPLVKWTVRDLKYHRRSERARALADAAIPYIEDYLSDLLQGIGAQPLVFVPIPGHISKARSRGFNQSELLATWWTHAIAGSSVRPLLRKTVFTLPQARLSRSARLKNVAHTMECGSTLDPTQIYVVVDDVSTTGATFDEARRALRVTGARKIICIALAHGYNK